MAQAIGASGLFDEPWYVENYGRNIPKGVPPLLHLVIEGAGGDYSPGPRFDARYYLENNPDVAQVGAHPVVHYVLHGRKEGRRSRPMPLLARPDLSTLEMTAVLGIISDSGFFDRDWYLAAHPDLRHAGLDPLKHYVEHGAAELRRPNAWFDPEYYLHRTPELANKAANALLHFIASQEHGAVAPNALLDAAFDKRPGSPPAADDVYLEPPRPRQAVDWTPYADLAAADGAFALRLKGRLLGRLASAEALPRVPAALQAFCDLCGILVDENLRLIRSGPEFAETRVAACEGAVEFPAMGRKGEGLRIADAWFADETLIRLRLADLPDGEPDGEPVVLRAFQPDGAGGVTFTDEACVRGAQLPIAGLRLANPLTPVLIVTTSPQGLVRHVDLLAFPSLCRGGWHHAELCAETGGAFADLAGYAARLLSARLNDWPGRSPINVAVLPEEATGAERLFSTWTAEWLACVFGRHLDRNEGPSAEGSRLSLPPSFLPAIGALVAPSGDRRAARPAGYALVDAMTGEPRWAAAFPPGDMPHGDFVGDRLPKIHGASPAAACLAIGVVDEIASADTRRLAPTAFSLPARGAPSVDWSAAPQVAALVRAPSVLRAEDAILSLAAQQGSERLAHIYVAAPAACGEIVRTCFPGRCTLVDGSAGLAPLLATIPAELTLILDGAVPHDPRTLETLVALACDSRVFSSACAVTRLAAGPLLKATGAFGGYVLERRRSTPDAARPGPGPSSGLAIAPLTAMEILPRGTYPVLANGLRAAVVRTSAAATILGRLGPQGEDEVAVGLAALEMGLVNLSTSAIRAVADERTWAPPQPSSETPAAWRDSPPAALTIERLAG